MTEDLAVSPLHIMITVSDIDRSVAFYTRALGFKLGYDHEASETFAPAIQLSDVKFREVFLVLGGMMITLCGFANPKTVPAPEAPFNQIGIKRIAFGVPDLDAAAERVKASGGQVLEHTRYAHPQATLVVITDPDGNQLELIQRST